jgi:hypothetical protein
VRAHPAPAGGQQDQREDEGERQQRRGDALDRTEDDEEERDAGG